MPTLQNAAGGNLAALALAGHPDAEQGADDHDDQELHADLHVVHVVRDAPRRGEGEARQQGDQEPDVHERRELHAAVVRLDGPRAEQDREADEVDEDDDVAEDFEGFHALTLLRVRAARHQGAPHRRSACRRRVSRAVRRQDQSGADRGIRGLGALVLVRAGKARAIDALLLVVEREHAEADRLAGVERRRG